MPLTRYRLIVLPLRKPKGPWRSTREAAVLDAIDRGFATRDEHDEKRLWWDPLADIEVSDEVADLKRPH